MQVEHAAPCLHPHPAGPRGGAGRAGGFPWEALAGAKGRGLPIPRGATGGRRGPGGGAGENPPGRHPEWLISADESLFSFRLNTLNRAPSDVYLHSLRANAGGGPRRRRRGPRGLGAAGKLHGGNGDGVVWERSGVSQSQPTWRTQPPAPREGRREQQPRVCIPASRHWAGGDPGGLFCCGPLSPTYMPASEAAALCAARCNIILVVQLRRLTCSRSHTLPHNRGHGLPERRGLTRVSFSQP